MAGRLLQNGMIHFPDSDPRPTIPEGWSLVPGSRWFLQPNTVECRLRQTANHKLPCGKIVTREHCAAGYPLNCQVCKESGKQSEALTRLG